MTQSGPWSVKGIDPKAREIAKGLARRSGVTLGEWLNQKITEGEIELDAMATVASDESSSDPAHTAAPVRRALPDVSSDEVRRLSAALDGLAAQLEASEGRSGAAIDHIDRSVRTALTRLESGERDREALSLKLESALDRVQAEQARSGERLLRVERDGANRIEALRNLEKALLRLKPADPAVVAELAVARMSDRLAAAEARTRDAVERLETSLAGLDQRLSHTQSLAAINDPGKVLATVERRFESLAEDLNFRVEAARVDMAAELGKLAGGDRVEVIEAAINQLAVQVDQSERSSAQAIDRMGREVLRIAETMGQRVSAVEHQQSGLADRFSGEMAKMADAMEKRLLRADYAQTEALQKLSGEITKIAERMADRVGRAEAHTTSGLDELGREVRSHAERAAEQVNGISRDLTDRIRQSEERTARLLEESQSRIEARLGGASEPAADMASVQASGAMPASREAPADTAVSAPPRRFAALEATRPAISLKVAPSETVPVSASAASLSTSGDILPSFESLMAERLAEGAPKMPSEAATASSPFLEDAFDDDDSFEAAASAGEKGLFEHPFLSDLEEAIDRASGIIDRTYHDIPADTPVVAKDAAKDKVSDADPFALDDIPQAPPPSAAAPAPDPFLDDAFVKETPARTEPERPDPDADAFERELSLGATPGFGHRPGQSGESSGPELDADALDRPMSTRDLIAQARLAARSKSEAESAKAGKPVRKSQIKPAGGFTFGFGKRKAKDRTVTTLTLFLATAVSITATASVIGFIMVNDAAQDGSKVRPQVARGDTPSAAPAAANATAPAAAPAAASQLAVATVADPAAAAPANPDDPATAYSLAVRLLDNHDAGAVAAMLRAANLGSAQAQYHLSTLYDKGAPGIEPDAAKARTWIERAANSGVPQAMYNLGLYLYAGKGGAADLPQSAEWFRRAAVAGMTNAQYNLGQLYEHGVGAPQNQAQAYEWYLIAAAAGDRDARADADRLRPSLNANARKLAEQGAASFRPQAPAAATTSVAAR